MTSIKENPELLETLKDMIRGYFGSVSPVNIVDIRVVQEAATKMADDHKNLETRSLEGIGPIHHLASYHGHWIDEGIVLAVTLPVRKEQVLSGSFGTGNEHPSHEVFTAAFAEHDRAKIYSEMVRHYRPYSGNWMEVWAKSAEYTDKLLREAGFDSSIPTLFNYFAEHWYD